MHIYVDALASWLHFVLIFALIAALVGELVLCKLPLTADIVRRLTRFDFVYGMTALLLLIVGFWRAMAYAKGWSFYSVQPWFWFKVATFAAVGIVSIYPTVHFIRWNRAAKRGEAPHVSPERIKKIRGMIHLELALLPIIAFAAVMMARGL